MNQIKLYLVISVLTCLGINATASPVRIKNFREIYSSYANITGVDSSDSELQSIFSVIKDRLPKFGLPQEFSNNTVLAMTELSGHFCQRVIIREENQTYGERIMFSDIDFARGPSQFSDYLIAKIGEGLAKMFWLRQPKPNEIETIAKVVGKAAIVEDDSTDATKRVLQILCATYASSLAFIAK